MSVSRRLIVLVLTGSGVFVLAACAWFLRPRPPPAAPPEAPPAAPTQREVQPFEAVEVVYRSGFAKGWEDFGWGPRGATDGGALRVGFAGYGGVIFRHAELAPSFGALVFQYRAPASFGNFLAVLLMNDKRDENALPEVVIEPRHVAEREGGWREVMVPLLALNPSNVPFDRIVIRARQPVATDWVEIDNVVLTKQTAEQAAVAPKRPVKLAIDCRAPATAISPLIYGIARGSAHSASAATG
jgi:hypothetical protein